MATILLARRVFAIFNSRIHVILLPALLTQYWSVGYRFPLPAGYYLMISLNTAAAYWTNLITDEKEDSLNYAKSERFLAGKLRLAKVLVVLCYSGSLYLALQANWRVVLFGAILNSFGTFYGLEFPLPPPWYPRRTRLKSVPWLKNAYSSFFWSVALLLTPYVYLGTMPEPLILLAIATMFLLAFFVELLWDVRDVIGDRFAGVRTIPVTMGEPISRWILHALNVLGTLVLVAGILLGWLPGAYWVILAHAVGAAFFVEFYMKMPRRQLASHVFVLFQGLIMVATIVVDRVGREGVPAAPHYACVCHDASGARLTHSVDRRRISPRES